MTATSLVREAPGLVAVALYLRPARRAAVVGSLIELGIFVREFQTHPADTYATEEPAEMFLVFASAQASHFAVIERLALAGRVVVAIIPEGVRAEPFERAGAFRVLTEADAPDETRRAFSHAGQAARQRRGDQARQRRPARIFGVLEFHPGEPWLASRDGLAVLSPIEYGVLRALVTAQGAVVSKEELQLRLSSTSEPASDGYLKTVVLRIRRKAETLGGDSSQLAAVRGTGYVLRA